MIIKKFNTVSGHSNAHLQFLIFKKGKQENFEFEASQDKVSETQCQKQKQK
jgi:hypothetical protein